MPVGVLPRGRPRRTRRRRLRTLLQVPCAAAGSERDDPASPTRHPPQAPRPSGGRSLENRVCRESTPGTFSEETPGGCALRRGADRARGARPRARLVRCALCAHDRRGLRARNISPARMIRVRAVRQCRAQSAHPSEVSSTANPRSCERRSTIVAIRTIGPGAGVGRVAGNVPRWDPPAAHRSCNPIRQSRRAVPCGALPARTRHRLPQSRVGPGPLPPSNLLRDLS